VRARGWGSTPSRQSACERALRWASGCDRRTASTERCSHRWTRERPYSRQSDTRRQVPRPRRTRETVWTASWPTTTSSLIVAKCARCRRYAGSCVLAGPKPRPTAPAHIIYTILSYRLENRASASCIHLIIMLLSTSVIRYVWVTE